MKKLIILLLAVSLLLCSCNKTDNQNKDNETTGVVDGYVHDYDENDRLALTVQYKDGAEVSRIEYSYDSEGNLVLLKTTADGQLVQTISHEYENNVHVNSTKEFKDFASGIICREYSEFDGDGKTTFTEYFEDGQWVGRENYTYDENEDLVKKETVDKDGNVLTHEEYTYNQVNQIIRTDCYEFGSLAFYYIYKYDNMGDMSSATKYDPNGNVIEETKQ
ncbi:MAG: hypothetical protein IKK26_01130 [Clostridia bacterium]|nr:hypothetical protein [Clostridia bacterium]